MRMRRTSGLLTAILVGLSVAGATPAAAQSQFVEVDYMKVAPGQDDAYLQVEQKMWKPIHEARVKAGNAVAWYLYRVVSPSGSQVDHNYATVAVYSSFEAMENPYPNELLAKIVPAHSDRWKRYQDYRLMALSCTRRSGRAPAWRVVTRECRPVFPTSRSELVRAPQASSC